MCKLLSFLAVFLFVLQVSFGQNRGDIRVMFYNTENLFDTIDNPVTADDEFTPGGRMKWSSYRYYVKLQHIFKVVAGIGEWQPPEIIGLCEVENGKVLNDLLTRTPLKKFRYGTVHFESPDPRGIDAALLYRPDKVHLLSSRTIPVIFPGQANHHTRDILMVTLSIAGAGTLTVFINHWPSRRGGAAASQYFRMIAARSLRLAVDSVLTKNPESRVLIMGDFNDEPSDNSVVKGLKALPPNGTINDRYLYNLIPVAKHGLPAGSIYYRGQWQLFDQMIVSGSLLHDKATIFTSSGNVHIFAPAYVLQYDDKNLVYRTFPTYLGPRYLGGYSDHLPVYADLFIKK